VILLILLVYFQGIFIMWCSFDKSRITIALTCMVVASVVGSDIAFAARQRNYKPEEFRSVLHGLGYNVKVTKDPLTDEETKKAITQFQTGYKLKVDGKVGPQTQDKAAMTVQILQANLNTVLKPKTPLPRDQFYSPQTEESVKEYQKKHQLSETGIADLQLRQRLNEEVKSIISTPVANPTPTAKPTATPTAKPKATPTAKPKATPTAKPTATPTAKPTATPTAKPKATPTAKPKATPTAKPKATPTAKPKATPTAKPEK
jgi:peptidoglycan hydrolase-like protein with peptidoglycan-binding domain